MDMNLQPYISKQGFIMKSRFALAFLSLGFLVWLQACSNNSVTPQVGSVSGTVSITASPSSNVSINSTVTLTAATSDGSTNPAFTFSLAYSISGVTLSQVSPTSAQLTSSVATTAYVNVVETSTGTTSQTTVTFGIGSTTTGTLQVSVNNSLVSSNSTVSVATGSNIALSATASGVTNPVFVFSLSSQPSGVNLTNTSNGFATLYSSVVTSVVVNVNLYSSGSSGVVATQQVNLQFGTGSYNTGAGYGTLNCSFAGGTAFQSYLGYDTVLQLQAQDSVTGAYQQVAITSFYPGAPWSYSQSYPLYYPYNGSATLVSMRFSSPGVYYGNLTARSVSTGAVCNGGNPLSFTIYVR
jgi:hypothetical protein